MQKISFLFAICLLLLGACNSKKQEASLPQDFLESLEKKDFDRLKSYLPTVEFYKSLGPSVTARSDEEIKEFLNNSNDRLKEVWTEIGKRISSGQTDLSKVKINETILFSPFEEKKNQMMVILYEYDGRKWDDILFSVSEWNGKTYLLEIPNTYGFFSREDTSLRNSSQAKLSIEMNKPEFKKALEERQKEIAGYAKENKKEDFINNLVYVGSDETRRWKSPATVDDVDMSERAMNLMERVNREMAECENYSFKDIFTERESEGTWIILPVNCGKKTVHFAFLKINDRYLLGAIDMETNK